MQWRSKITYALSNCVAITTLFFVGVSQACAQASAVAQGFVDNINTIFLFPLINLLLGVAIVVFMWGGFQYVANADNDSARQAGARHLLYGVIGIMVMVSALAILNLAAGTFGIAVPG